MSPAPRRRRECGAAGQQGRDVGGQVGGNVLAQRVDRDVVGAAVADGMPSDDTQPKRRVVRRPGQSVTVVVCVDIVHDDLGVAHVAPRSTVCRLSTSTLSLRQLTPNVHRLSAVRAALR